MNRRTFIAQSTAAATALAATPVINAFAGADPLYGHNGMTYKQVKGWGVLDNGKYPVNDCHEMVQDRRGRLLLLTNETRNNVLVYNTSGKLLTSWGHDFPGAHGLTLAGEGRDEFLLITDTARHQVYKTTLDGKVLWTLDAPLESELYDKAESFVPTETAVAPNGDIYVADGYGRQYIFVYDAQGKLKSWFGGKGEGDQYFETAHGVCIDHRTDTPTLLVTDRPRQCFKRFTLAGELIEIIALPGACVCRPVIHGTHLYSAVLRSPDMDTAGSGFVTILDENNRVVSNIGGTAPVYVGDQLQPMGQQSSLFVHPHDVCVDRDENVYVPQWASGKVYPYKFERVS